MKQQVTDSEDTQDNAVAVSQTVAPPQSVSAPTAFSRSLRSATPQSRSRSRSRSQSSSSSSSSSAAAEADAEADMEGFDFEESINSKRRELLADAALSATNEKTASATASVSKSENTDDAGKKPFINGIDMFAEELHIEAESYNVSALSRLSESE